MGKHERVPESKLRVHWSGFPTILDLIPLWTIRPGGPNLFFVLRTMCDECFEFGLVFLSLFSPVFSSERSTRTMMYSRMYERSIDTQRASSLALSVSVRGVVGVCWRRLFSDVSRRRTTIDPAFCKECLIAVWFRPSICMVWPLIGRCTTISRARVRRMLR